MKTQTTTEDNSSTAGKTAQLNLSFKQTQELVSWLDADDKAVREAPSILAIREKLRNQVEHHKEIYGKGDN